MHYAEDSYYNVSGLIELQISKVMAVYPDQENETNIKLNIRHVTQSYHNKGQQCTEMTRNILRELH